LGVLVSIDVFLPTMGLTAITSSGVKKQPGATCVIIIYFVERIIHVHNQMTQANNTKAETPPISSNIGIIISS
jgi:hypothetical protein